MKTLSSMAFLITCAGSKNKPIKKLPSSLDQLSFHEELGNARNKLLELNPQIILNWGFTLPAWQLYSGTYSKLYPRVTHHNWTKQCVDIKILSALFGWVRHTDLLPYYDLRMSDKITQNSQAINKFWHSQKLLSRFINPHDFDLLSGDYRKAINGNTKQVSKIPEVHFTDYGVQKGIWLNNQLQNIICN
jgi:cytoplasmic iron level regulating protein YaaA (DUF328/UPF0246 family)